jgi:2-keto-3-deoxy-6-phosphogluconate aldolase
MNIRSLLALAPVIPVLTIEKVEDAVPLGRALCAGGLRALEVTLRTSACLPAIEAMRKALPEAIVGVGTLTRAARFRRREQCRRAVRRQSGLDRGAGRCGGRRSLSAVAGG